MNLSVFLQQPEFAVALIILLVLQIAILILLINLHLKTPVGRSVDLKIEKQPAVDDKLKQVNERLRDDEKRQEQIRRNYEDNSSRDKDQRPPFKGPNRGNQDRNFNRDNRDRDRNRDGRDGRDNRDNRDNRDRNRDRDRDRNRNRDGFDRQGGNRPQFDPQRNRENTPPVPAQQPKVEEVSAPIETENTAAPAPMESGEFGHGRRPIVKRRHLGNGEGAEGLVSESAEPASSMTSETAGASVSMDTPEVPPTAAGSGEETKI
jgi:hypothetical protein